MIYVGIECDILWNPIKTEKQRKFQMPYGNSTHKGKKAWDLLMLVFFEIPMEQPSPQKFQMSS